MTKRKTIVSCYGFWPGIPDGVAGVGPPRTVYCMIGDEAKGLKLENGDVIDLLDAKNVHIYGPCTLVQMIGYINDAPYAKGGSFKNSVFADIVTHPERYEAVRIKNASDIPKKGHHRETLSIRTENPGSFVPVDEKEKLLLRIRLLRITIRANEKTLRRGLREEKIKIGIERELSESLTALGECLRSLES